MTRFPRLAALCVIGIVLATACALAPAVELTMYVNPIEGPFVRRVVESWSEKTGHTVRILMAPASSSDALALYQQQLAAGTADVDLYQIDSVWPGLLGKHFVDLLPYTGGVEDLHIKSSIDNTMVGGRLVSLPLYLDAGMMYYRTDLLERYGKPVPSSWSELAATARDIVAAERRNGNNRMWGLVFQGRAYEGLTCVALEWLASSGGGTIVDANGVVTVNNPAAVQALREAASWIGDITPKGALNYAEEEARGVFQSGDAVFMRNWPYVWALAQKEESPVTGKIGIMPIPVGGAGGRPSGALGGWNIAVSRYSLHREAAVSLLLHLTSLEGQRMFCLLGTYTPSIVRLFDDPDIRRANPAAILEVFENAVPRPSGVCAGRYNRVSNEFYNTVHTVLSGYASPEKALADLEAALKRVARRGWK